MDAELPFLSQFIQYSYHMRWWHAVWWNITACWLRLADPPSARDDIFPFPLFKRSCLEEPRKWISFRSEHPPTSSRWRLAVTILDNNGDVNDRIIEDIYICKVFWKCSNKIETVLSLQNLPNFVGSTETPSTYSMYMNGRRNWSLQHVKMSTRVPQQNISTCGCLIKDMPLFGVLWVYTNTNVLEQWHSHEMCIFAIRVRVCSKACLITINWVLHKRSIVSESYWWLAMTVYIYTSPDCWWKRWYSRR